MALLLCLGTTQAQPNGPPVLIYGVGGRDDAAFNSLARQGARRFSDKTGINFAEAEAQGASSRAPLLRNLARERPALIIALGASMAEPVDLVCRELPGQRFAIIDALVPLPNVASIMFREEESAFLVGVAAAAVSKTGTIGFIGGRDDLVINKFADGFRQGARYQRGDIEVRIAFIARDDTGYRNLTRATDLARQQLGAGADVIFAAAGGAGQSVYQAVKQSGKLAIGVDANQNGLYPGTMLTSMLKRVDVVIENLMTDTMKGEWRAGTKVYGMKDGAVGWALDNNNRGLISPDLEARITEVQDDIVSGRLVVTPFKSLTAAR